jgi:hypothetical protein
MAIVTTSFNANGIQAASSAYLSSWNLSLAVTWGVAALDNANNLILASTTTSSPGFISGKLTNGDSVSFWGSNLNVYPATFTHLDYTFASQGVTVSLYGNVTKSTVGGSQTGYIDKVIVSSTNEGTITIQGYDDVASTSPSIISSAVSNLNGIQISGSGSVTASTTIVGGYYQTTLGGSYSSVALVDGDQTMQLSQFFYLRSLWQRYDHGLCRQ